MIRRRQQFVDGDVAWLEPISCQPVRSPRLKRDAERVRVDRDPPRLVRLVAERDEADVFRRTYIRPWPKEDQ